ncbi:MAG TPA: CpsB/CapC family capsule biosynthesis tyrosine phosphatase [Solirubrobacteraceae bacterium]|nr:CpsB/CapC family capsule biosynthesis tyrosine phosphatase [Solirubrobacteraceae bacterium]
MIDLHCHVLPGIDDGPGSIEDSMAMARAAARGGTRVMVATSHVSLHYRNDAATIERLAAELNARLRAEGVPVEIRPGAEIAVTHVGELDRSMLFALGLGGGPWLLLEPPFARAFTRLGPILLDLQRRGHRIVLAHPERCPVFHREPELLETLVDAGALTSLTAGSLVGAFGRDVRRFALELVRAGMAHNVASDAHDELKRPPSIAAELERAGLEPLAAWLTEEVPRAILAGEEEMPPRPEVAESVGRARARWWRGS